MRSPCSGTGGQAVHGSRLHATRVAGYDCRVRPTDVVQGPWPESHHENRFLGRSNERCTS